MTFILIIFLLLLLITFVAYVLDCPRCTLYHLPTVVRFEPYENVDVPAFKDDTEKLAFCAAIGNAVTACSQASGGRSSIECLNFNKSVQKMKSDLDVLFEMYNRNTRRKEI